MRLVTSTFLLGLVLLLAVAGSAICQTSRKQCPPVSPAPEDPAFKLDSHLHPEFLESEVAQRKLKGKVAVYAVVPMDECEIGSVFRGSDGTPAIKPTGDDLAELANVRTGILSVDVSFTDQARTEGGFQEFLSSTKEDLIAIVGHSDGGVFRFPDGTTSPLISMARECTSHGKACVFIAPVVTGQPRSAGAILVYGGAIALALDLAHLKGSESNESFADIVSLLHTGLPLASRLSSALDFIVDSSGGKSEAVGVLVRFSTVNRVELVHPSNSGDSLPVPLTRPRPNYTAKARDDKVQGVVRLRALVDAEGKVTDVRIVAGLPDGLNKEALKAVFQMGFRPGTSKGVAVAHWVAVEVEFDLHSKQR